MNNAEIAPEVFTWCLSGWPPPGPNAFRWKDHQLHYMLPRDGTAIEEWDDVADSQLSDWAKIWKLCDDLGIWSWPSNQGNLQVIDGLMYDVEIHVADRYVKSHGQIVGSPPVVREQVKQFHRALQSLVGWKAPVNG